MAAIAAALFRMLVPENKLSKQIAVLIAAVFILTGISALSGADFSFDSDALSIQTEELNTRVSAAVNEELEREVCAEMSNGIFSMLAPFEIYPEEIRVVVNISGLYSINITQVELVFKNGEQAAANAAAELLRNELSPDIKITTEVKE